MDMKNLMDDQYAIYLFLYCHHLVSQNPRLKFGPPLSYASYYSLIFGGTLVV